jgi:3-oxoacyl-[acyl-carrier-protein] synthase-1/3-oxoacyl-[acyl-carrier-protein] synthase II
VIAGQALGTLDTNAGYAARLRARGPTLVEPRVFPATSPNALVGECAIAFKLNGPSFSVGAGLDAGLEALAAGVDLCASGDADRVVIVAADDAGPAAQDLIRLAGWSHRAFARGAVALLLSADPEGCAREVAIVPPPDHRGGGPIGHLSLLRWLDGS